MTAFDAGEQPTFAAKFTAVMEQNAKKEQSVRIQTSLLNGLEKKALIWLANRQLKWADSDMLTFVGYLEHDLVKRARTYVKQL